MQLNSRNNKLTMLSVTDYGKELKHIHSALREWLSKCSPVVDMTKEQSEQLVTILKICGYEAE